MLDSARAVPWQTWLSGCLLVLCTILVIDNYSNGSKQSMFIVHPAGPADSDTGSSEGHSAQSVPLVQHIKHLGQRCTIESVEYISSTVEQEWIDNADTWDDETAFCREKARRADEIETLARLVTEMNERAGQPDSAWDAAEGTTNATVLKLLSRFNYKLSCGGKKTTVVEWIEPLYGGLRHPKTYCGAPDEWGLDRGYLLLTDPHTPRYHPQGRHFLFDLGASTFTSGLGGASQSFMIKAHGARGIQFDRILLWEADMRITDEQIFGEVPPEVLHAYPYFHMPAAADATSPGNPLQILKKIAKPEDFVAFKMDIDNGKIENALVEQIMADPELVALVDEFYFEHHVNWGMMLKWWVTCIDPNKRLVDSYKMYKKMRTMGIRAHGWP